METQVLLQAVHDNESLSAALYCADKGFVAGVAAQMPGQTSCLGEPLPAVLVGTHAGLVTGMAPRMHPYGIAVGRAHATDLAGVRQGGRGSVSAQVNSQVA